MIYAGILAGGVGRRMEGSDLPKQFIPIGDVPIIIRTLRVVLECKRFERIYIAVHKDWDEYLQDLLVKYLTEEQQNKISIIDGGYERIYSFINIVNEIVNTKEVSNEDIVICHESVRPFVTKEIIEECIEATLEGDFALTVAPVIDTIFNSSDGQNIDGTYPRENLYNGQTPSGFNVKLLYQACGEFTDDDKQKCTGTIPLILQLGHKIRIVNGNADNFKITNNKDLLTAKMMIKNEVKY